MNHANRMSPDSQNTEDAMFRLLFEGARDAIFWADAESGVILNCNVAAESLMAAVREDIIGLHQTELHPAGEKEKYRERFRQGTRAPISGPLEAMIKRSDGVCVPVEISSSIVEVDKRNLVLGIFRDITERKLVEQRYQSLFDEMLDGFALHEIICDANGAPVDYRFLAANPSFATITGLAPATIIGRTAREVIPDIESGWIEAYGRVALTGESTHFMGHSKALDQYFEVRAFQPAPGQFACVFADITRQKRAELELARHRRRLAELAADILNSGEQERRRIALELHDDVGQALAAAKLTAQQLARDVGETGEHAVAVRHLLDLLDYSVAGIRALSAELSPPILYELGIGPALKWLADRYRTGHELECEVHADAAYRELKTEVATLLFRAARELLDNIQQHAGVARASIRLVRREDMLVLCVEDKGCGFDFASMSAADCACGGFGLFGIREEIVLAGGTLEVDTCAGHGTRVDIRLPIGLDSGSSPQRAS